MARPAIGRPMARQHETSMMNHPNSPSARPKPKSRTVIQMLERHAEKDLHHADHQRDGEELSLEIEEFHRGGTSPCMLMPKNEPHEESESDRRHAAQAWRNHPPGASCRAFGSWRASTTHQGQDAVRSRRR